MVCWGCACPPVHMCAVRVYVVVDGNLTAGVGDGRSITPPVYCLNYTPAHVAFFVGPKPVLLEVLGCL